MLLDEYSSRAIPLLSGGVFLVFLVLCANVGSLLLAGVNVRRYEISVCSALGASRLRLMREVLAESAAIAVAGTVAGVVVGAAFVSLARAYLPDAFLMRTLHPLSLDPRALAVAVTLAAIAVLVTGLMPGFTGTRVDVGALLRTSNAATTSGPSSLRFGRALLISEIALACTLLVGATVLVRSFVNLTRTERGVDVNRVTTAWMSLPAAAFPDRATRTAAVRSIEEQVQRVPGVDAVAWSYGVPPSRGAISFGEWTSDGVRIDAAVDRYSVGRTFFAIYGIPLLRGRLLDPSDGPGSVIVGERLARMLWPDADPIGRAFGFGRERFRVIGVAREIRFPSIDAHVDRPEFYERFAGVGANAMMSVRCASSCPSPPAIRQAIALASPAVHTIDVRLLSDVYVEQLARPRAAAALGFAFAAIAAIAAAGGLFSVLTYAAGRRRREFGIRAALGASARQIRWMVMRDATTIAVGGLALGIVGAWMLGRVLVALEYGASASDIQTWGIVLGLLAATTLGAAWRPAHDATRVDLVSALRES